jgi:acyl carrier protein
MESSMPANLAHNATPAPLTETERILLQIWSEVLNTENISMHDDFLGLGGDSLAAMRCINRIGAKLGIELPLDLFLLDSASIAQIARELANTQRDSAEIVVPDSA